MKDGTEATDKGSGAKRVLSSQSVSKASSEKAPYEISKREGTCSDALDIGVLGLWEGVDEVGTDQNTRSDAL